MWSQVRLSLYTGHAGPQLPGVEHRRWPGELDWKRVRTSNLL